jgi:hypothetical protein
MNLIWSLAHLLGAGAPMSERTAGLGAIDMLYLVRPRIAPTYLGAAAQAAILAAPARIAAER